MPKGWFKTDEQDGERTLQEQMTGLSEALGEASGMSVLDLGCAEGLIALEFAKAGALRVTGIECNPVTVQASRKYCGQRCRIELGNLNTILLPAWPWDVVLALAILHKLRDPAGMVAQIAETGARLVVVRLPKGSTGKIVTKHYGTACDLIDEFTKNGFALRTLIPGPFGELVQYWRRS